MIILPNNFKVYQPDSIKVTAAMSVYNNIMRFNKNAISTLRLPRNFGFDPQENDTMMLLVREDGFEMQPTPAHTAYIIANRRLTSTILNHFGADSRLVFTITPTASPDTWLAKLVIRQ